LKNSEAFYERVIYIAPGARSDIKIKNYPSLIAFIKGKSVGQLSKKSSEFV
jgi:hypothetical protein